MCPGINLALAFHSVISVDSSDHERLLVLGLLDNPRLDAANFHGLPRLAKS